MTQLIVSSFVFCHFTDKTAYEQHYLTMVKPMKVRQITMEILIVAMIFGCTCLMLALIDSHRQMMEASDRLHKSNIEMMKLITQPKPESESEADHE